MERLKALYNKYREVLEMFNFSTSGKDKDGNTYCFDRITGEVLRARFEKVAINTVPQEALLAILKKESKATELLEQMAMLKEA